MERDEVAVAQRTLDDRSMKIFELLVSLAALGTVAVLTALR